jgi:glucose-6-phosphate-specific signal transduction histidine kinase
VYGSGVNRSNGHALSWQRWGQHLALAAAYGAVYEVARHLSFPQWMLTAGLRLGCLFLLPTRFWPALALGEGIPLLEVAALNVERFGFAWAVSEAVPMVVLWMALMKPLLDRWSIHDERGQVRMNLILVAALGVAAITAVATMLTALTAIIHTPTGAWPDPNTGFVGYLCAYFLGAYLGALTLTPTVLALHERFRGLGGKPLTFSLVWRSPLLRDTLGWVLPVLAVLSWLTMDAGHEGLRQVARFALVLPVLVMAWRHGWHGASVGGMCASIALAVVAPGPLADAATIQVEAVLALVVSGSLLVAVRVPAMNRALRSERS